MQRILVTLVTLWILAGLSRESLWPGEAPTSTSVAPWQGAEAVQGLPNLAERAPRTTIKRKKTTPRKKKTTTRRKSTTTKRRSTTTRPSPIGAQGVATIFDESLNPSYSSWSYSYASLSLASTWQPKIGNVAIRSRLHAWGAVSLHRASVVGGGWNSTSWAGIEFWVSSSDISAVYLTLEDTNTNLQSPWVAVSSLFSFPATYAGQANGTMPQLRKAFAPFGGTGWRDTFDRIYWFDNKGKGLEIAVDSIRLVARPARPPITLPNPPPTTAAAPTPTRTRTATFQTMVVTTEPKTSTLTPVRTLTPTTTLAPPVAQTPTATRTLTKTVAPIPPPPPPPPPPTTTQKQATACASVAPATNTAATLPTPSLAACELLRLDVGLVNSFLVDRYTYRDSQGLTRSISLARYATQNGNRGGFVVQMTYYDTTVNPASLVTAGMPAGRGDAGFGYVVSHEYYRTFSDGSSGTIAGLHGEDDSPLGLYLTSGASGSNTLLNLLNGTAVHAFKMTYPRWGTTTPLSDPWSTTPVSFSGHAKYSIPVTFGWTLKSGTDHPRFFIEYDLQASDAQRGCITMDTRSPYGVLDFDNGAGSKIATLEWADKYRFRSQGTELTTQSGWTWNTATPSGARRYNLLITTGGYEMGLVQTVPYSQSTFGTSYSDSRGLTSSTQNGCPSEGWKLPCDWSWPYQSVNYEIDSSGVWGKKMAWGSSYMLGQLGSWDDIGDPVSGWPKVSYEVDVVLAKTSGSTTRSVANFA